MKFLHYVVDKTKLVNILTIGLLVAGIVSIQAIKREAFPKVDFDVLLITTLYPGAAPEDVELNVTVRLEEQIRTVSGLKQFTSASREGYSMIQVQIDPDVADKEKVKDEVQKAVDRVTDLPPEVENRPSIFELKTDNFEVIQVSLSSDQVDETALRQYGRELKRRLENLSRVAGTTTLGFRQREIQVLVDLDALQSNYLSLADLANTLRQRNVRIPAGSVRDGSATKSVVTEAKFRDVTDVEHAIVRTNFEGNRIRVKDVARVEDTFQEYQDLIKMNGKLGVTINVLKGTNADILRTVDQVKDTVRAFREEVGDRVDVSYINDVSKSTRSILGIVVTNAVFGMILVLAVLLVFLNLRTALWTAAGIPLALFATLTLMVIFDFSLNGNSLLGMVIVLGMLVDDAIVIAEAIYTQRLRGVPALQAAREGLKQVALPVLVTVVTTILAFAPLLFLPGIPGKFVLPIPAVITFALLGSLFESYFILPNHLTAHSLNADETPAVKGLQEKAWFPVMRNKYGALLHVCLRHRFWLTLVFVILLAVSLVYALTQMKFLLFPQTTIEQVVVYLEAENGTSLQRMNDLTQEIEAVLQAQPKRVIDAFTTQIARGQYEMRENENYATITVYFPPVAEQTIDPQTVIQALKTKISQMPAILNARYELQRAGPPVGADVEVRWIGNDNAIRAGLVRQTRDFLGTLDGVSDIDSSAKPGKPELVLTFDYERLARYGLNAADVGLTVRTALEGTIVGRTFTPDERIDYRVLLEPRYRESGATLKRLKVANAQRTLVPITHTVDLTEKQTVGRIDHFNGDRVTTVQANVDKQTTTPLEVTNRLRPVLDEMARQQPGFFWEIGGEAQQSQEFLGEVAVAFVVALLAIYFILSLLFNSFLQPFIVMVTIPFGIIGVIWTFVLHGLDFSFLTLIGVVGLSGVVVNDSLIMVDTINQLVKQKMCRRFADYLAAVSEGARTRLRPIILTTVTTVAGVMPTAYGLGGYVESIAPMVLAIGWGILFASTLTLFLLPGLYLIEVQIEFRLSRWLPWLPLKTQCGLPPVSVRPD